MKTKPLPFHHQESTTILMEETNFPTRKQSIHNCCHINPGIHQHSWYQENRWWLPTSWREESQDRAKVWATVSHGRKDMYIRALILRVLKSVRILWLISVEAELRPCYLWLWATLLLFIKKQKLKDLFSPTCVSPVSSPAPGLLLIVYEDRNLQRCDKSVTSQYAAFQ